MKKIFYWKENFKACGKAALLCFMGCIMVDIIFYFINKNRT